MTEQDRDFLAVLQFAARKLGCGSRNPCPDCGGLEHFECSGSKGSDRLFDLPIVVSRGMPSDGIALVSHSYNRTLGKMSVHDRVTVNDIK